MSPQMEKTKILIEVGNPVYAIFWNKGGIPFFPFFSEEIGKIKREFNIAEIKHKYFLRGKTVIETGNYHIYVNGKTKYSGQIIEPHISLLYKYAKNIEIENEYESALKEVSLEICSNIRLILKINEIIENKRENGPGEILNIQELDKVFNDPEQIKQLMKEIFPCHYKSTEEDTKQYG